MIYTEKQYEEMKKYYEDQLKKANEKNELKEKEVKLLKKQNKEKDEVIHDLDRNNYRGQCESLKLENKELKKKVEKLEDLLGITKTRLNKDSSNSCKPSSTNGFKKVVQNNRVKSGKKPGREKGHEKSAPTLCENPDKIIKVQKVGRCTCGCKTEEIEKVARDLVSIEIITHTTQYVGIKTKCPCCQKVYSPKFPKSLKSIKNYDEAIKTLVLYLNAHCNVPNQKVAEFLDVLSNGKIQMSQGTVGNTVAQFSKKSQPILKEMKKEILKAPVIHEDESPMSVGGKIMSAIGVYTNAISLTEALKNRTMESFQEMGILDRYIGTVCHDHNKIHQSFIQSSDAECNFHILRYCKGEYETHQRQSILDFMNYLLLLRDKVDEYKMQGKTEFTEEEYTESKRKYLELVDIWEKEFKKEYTAEREIYYKGERCLIARLKEYVDDHLRFLTDFRIEFTNNLAERGLRKIKGKLKISGGFRSLKFAKYYCDAISIIDTCKKQNMNIWETIEDIFMGKKKIFAF